MILIWCVIDHRMGNLIPQHACYIFLSILVMLYCFLCYHVIIHMLVFDIFKPLCIQEKVECSKIMQPYTPYNMIYLGNPMWENQQQKEALLCNSKNFQKYVDYKRLSERSTLMTTPQRIKERKCHSIWSQNSTLFFHNSTRLWISVHMSFLPLRLWIEKNKWLTPLDSSKGGITMQYEIFSFSFYYGILDLTMNLEIWNEFSMHIEQ